MLFSKFGHEFKYKNSTTYRHVDSDGLAIFKKGGKWWVTDHSQKIGIPSGDIFKLTEYFLGVQTKGDYEALKEVCLLIAECSGQSLDFLEVDTTKPRPKLKKKYTPALVPPFIPNYGQEPKITYVPLFASWLSDSGRATLQYFKEYGITERTLKKYRIEPLEGLKSFKGSLHHQFNFKDFAFAYIPTTLDSNIKYKRPNHKRKEGYIQSTGNYVFGLDQLPDNTTGCILIIAAGEKDCLAINEHLNSDGIYSICFQSETVNLNKDFIKNLKNKFNGNLFTLYDNDKAGILGMNKAETRNYIKSIRIEKYVNNKVKYDKFDYKEIEYKVNKWTKKPTKKTINNTLNDASDLIKELGVKDGVKELRRIVKSEISNIWSKRIEIIPRNGYVTDVMKGIDSANKILSFYTGKGKTNYIINGIDGYKIILCPTIALVQNIINDERYKHLDIFEFRSTKEQKAKLSTGEFPKIIATTYNSFKNLDKLLIGSHHEIQIIIDEWQTLILGSNEGFMYEDNEYIIKRMKFYQSIRLLSATPVFNVIPAIQQLTQIKSADKPTKKELYLYDCDNVNKETALNMQESLSKGRTPLTLLDNKSKKGRLGSLLSLIDDNRIMAFNSETKSKKEHEQLVKTGYLPNHIKGGVFTSVFKAGNNLRVDGGCDIFILGSFHTADMIQFIGRARNATDIKVHIMRGAKRQEQDKNAYFDFNREAYNIKENAISKITDYNRKDATPLQLIRERKVDNRLGKLPIQINSEGKYYVCDILLSNQVNHEYTVKVNQQDKLLIEALKEANIVYSGEVEKLTNRIGDEEKQIIKANRKTSTDIQQKQFNEFYNRLNKESMKQAFCNRIIKDKKSNPMEVKISKRYLSLNDEIRSDKEIMKLIDDIGTTDSKYKKVIARIDVLRLYKDSDYMNSTRLLSLLMKSIYREFKAGNKLTSKAIEEKLVELFDNHKGYDPKKVQSSNPKNHTKAINILRMFFELEPTKDIDGKRGHTIKKVSLNLKKQGKTLINSSRREKRLLKIMPY